MMRLVPFLFLLLLGSSCPSTQVPFSNQRPLPTERKFVSTAVDEAIATMSTKFVDPELARLFENCYPNTLDTTIAQFRDSKEKGPWTFVVTGDIDAMWLRDSTNQVLPYMRFAKKDPHLRRMLCGVLQSQSEFVLKDPYANAFNPSDTGAGFQDDQRRPPMGPGIFEGKYELDSLLAVIKLGHSYYSATRDASCFALNDEQWYRASKLIVDTIIEQQASTSDNLEDEPYLFQRRTSVATDTLSQKGRGASARRCGLSKSHFRPSDDAATLPFLVPANAMAVVELKHLAWMLPLIHPMCQTSKKLASTASWLAGEIDVAIKRHAVMTLISGAGKSEHAFAYEVDGFGNRFFADDANIPSLLSLPYLGYSDQNDAVYRTTRRLVLSERNKFYFQGTAASGIGGPHVGPGQIWPMSIIMQALTSDSDTEIMSCLKLLKTTTAGKFFMHESFDKDDPTKFSRPWFAWANTLFGELILQIADTRPHLIFKLEAGPKFGFQSIEKI